jgi:hypothetical protein
VVLEVLEVEEAMVLAVVVVTNVGIALHMVELVEAVEK